jgi:hypothetical protein
VFTTVIRDAARQYRRRPLAALLLLGLNLGLLLELAPAPVQGVAWLPLTAVRFVAELFVIAWLGGVIDRSYRTARESLRAALAAVWPALRASLLALCYMAVVLLIGLALFGRGFDGSARSVSVLMAGTAPLIGFALAFLAVLVPPLVLDGERKVLVAAARSHRIAARYFPICLLIGLADAANMALDAQRWSLPVLAAALGGLSLLRPFVLGMANSLYLRTRQEALIERARRV